MKPHLKMIPIKDKYKGRNIWRNHQKFNELLG